MVAGVTPLALPDTGDTAFLLLSLCIALLAGVPGILMLFGDGRGAFARALAATMAAGAVAALLYAALGYSLIYDIVTVSGFSGLLGGGQNAMLGLMGTLRDGTAVPETAFAAAGFAPILLALSLLCGALAGRARSGWLLGFCTLWFALVLIPVSRWLWGGGWLESMGALDASGGLVLYTAAGLSALVAGAMVGADGSDEPADGANLLGGAALTLVAALALGGSATLGAGDNAAVAMLATLLGAATAMLTTALLRRNLEPATLGLGLLAGTVALASAGDAPSPGGAIAIGALGAAAAAWLPRLLPRRLTQDIHGGVVSTLVAAGLAGGLLTAPFLSFEIFGGSGYAPGTSMVDQLVAQVTAAAAVVAWSVAGTLVAALMAAAVVPMRR